MGIAVPADHVGEGIVAVHLGVGGVVFGEELPVYEGDGLIGGGAQHPPPSWVESIMGRWPGMGLNPIDL